MNTATAPRGGTNPRPRILPALLLGVLGLATIVASVPRPAFAAAPAEPAVASPAQAPARALASLDAAVAAGYLDGDALETLRATGHVDAVVVFDGAAVRHGAEAGAAAGARANRADRLVEGLRNGHRAVEDRALRGIDGVEVLDPIEGLSLASVRFTKEAGMLRVVRDGAVLSVQLPERHEPQLDSSLGVIRQPTIASLGYKGAGTTIAIIDTGVNWSSGHFGTCPAPGAAGCRVIEAIDYAPDDFDEDDDGHGTNVAGIAAAVAPGARLLAYDVFHWRFTEDGFENLADDEIVVKAIARAIAVSRTHNVRAINLSLGSSGDDARWTSTCPTIDGKVNLYAQAFADARAAGILPVVAAGNDAVREDGSFGAGIAFPACTAGAVSVGATYDADEGAQSFTDCADLVTGRDRITCFSQSGPNLTVLAPGACIVAAGVGDDYVCYGGTSQAAPHVAGAAAVLAAARPSATLAQITSAIAGTGPLIADTRPGAGQVRRLDLHAAVSALVAAASTDTTKPVFTTASPTQAITAGRTLSTNGATDVTFGWRATDASGIARYWVSLRANGGAWTDHSASLAAPAAESVTFRLAPGVRYELAVMAQDKAGNRSGWRYGPPVTLGVVAENGSGVTYPIGGWVRPAWGSALGGYLATGKVAGTKAVYSFTGRHVAWVATTATNRGVARVYLDGVLVRTIDLGGASTIARRVQFSVAVSPAVRHTLEIRVVGTAGRPTVDVDAFAVLR